jgi:hypothetical protein
MSAYLDFTEAQALTVLRSFLLSILPPIEVVRGQINRVGEPTAGDFVVMTPILRTRLETNTPTYMDAVFTGSIAATTLTVSAVAHGSILVGAPVAPAPGGHSVADETYVVAQLTGSVPGDVGTYRVSVSQTVASGGLLAGVVETLQPTQLTVQLDVHGPASGDNAQIIATLFRDPIACQAFRASGFPTQPLYASDPAQRPFQNAQDQIEYRWGVDAVIQVNPAVSTLQQFAASLAATLVSVDATYPP